MALVCYRVTELDKAIASKMGSFFSPRRVSNLRALYDNTQLAKGGEALKVNPTDPQEVAKARDTLRAFWKAQNQERAKTLKYTASHIAQAYKEVRTAFTLQERLDRVNMIATMFSSVVDEIQSKHPELARQQIARGYEDSEEIFRYGEYAIFQEVFDKIIDNYNNKDTYTEEQREEFLKVYNNWPALLTYARMMLRNTEGVKLGNFTPYAGKVTEEDYSGNVLEELFDPETTTLESWQTSNDARSAFGSIGVQVRGIISRVPALTINEQGETVESRDSLGYPKYLNPVVVHAKLQEIFKGMTSSEDMINRLKKEGPWAKYLVDVLENNPTIRTKFFCDFKKTFQTYAITTQYKGFAGFKRQVLKILNQAKNHRKSDVLYRVKKGKVVDEKVSIYDANGNLNVQNLNKILKFSRERYEEKSQMDASNVSSQFGQSTAGYWQHGGSAAKRRQDLITILNAYGIEVSADEVASVMNNKKDIRRLVELLGKLSTYAIPDQIVKQASQYTVSYYELLKDSRSGLHEYITKITDIIARNNEGLVAENKILYIDKKNKKKVSLFSFVNPNYMSDTFDRIQSFVTLNDKEGLKKYLTDNYFCSSYFYDSETKTILNSWLAELWNCCLERKPLSQTSAADFTYLRFLGAQDQVFENFTSKQHHLAIITAFMNDKSVSSKAATALYPTFVLGDAGCQKFIRAKRYFNEDQMIDAYYNVYRQEVQRMKLAAAMSQKLAQEGYTQLSSFTKHDTTFSCLTFLNEDFVAEDGTIGKYAKMINSEDPINSVKKAIREYLNEGYEKYKKELEKEGLLEQKEGQDPKTLKPVQQYVYFNPNVNSSNIDAALKNMYMNIKLATIQQLQFMTIDPSFYKDTKDLQKRYKEVHAPGTLLDILAVDNNGKKFSERDYERVVYIKDIEINMEQAAPEFMKCIGELYGVNSDIYNQYKKASLTDGQGFRSLSSYRAVLGMAGKWEPEMETAYNTIMDIRQRYRGLTIPENELKRISELSSVFMPIKPYMYTQEKFSLGNDNVLIPVQHKYAEIVVIPELLPEGSKLKKMAEWMENNDVDMIAADSAVKVGAFGVTDIQNVTNESLHQSLSAGYVHQLRYSDYRIQTNVPEHINGSNLFGTQLRKFIVAAINKDRFYTIKGQDQFSIDGEMKELTGNDLMALYNSIINANIEQDLNSFLTQIKNPKEVSEALMQAAISNSTVAIDILEAVSCVEREGKPSINHPLFEGSIANSTSSHLISWYKKQVNKQKIAGGLLVQASGLGIGNKSEDSSLKYETEVVYDQETGQPKTVITAAQVEIPFNLSYRNTKGETTYLKYEDYCNPDGTLKTNENGVPLVEDLLPGCTNIIAYRTPTEGMCSMLNCKVVRFTRPVEGGIIRVPVQGSVTGGWDFDKHQCRSKTVLIAGKSYGIISSQAV